jgi:hypothetical protein
MGRGEEDGVSAAREDCLGRCVSMRCADKKCWKCSNARAHEGKRNSSDTFGLEDMLKQMNSCPMRTAACSRAYQCALAVCGDSCAFTTLHHPRHSLARTLVYSALFTRAVCAHINFWQRVAEIGDSLQDD